MLNLKLLVVALMVALVATTANAGVGAAAKAVGETAANANFVVGAAGDPANLNTTSWQVFVTANREGFQIAPNLYALGIGLDLAAEFGTDIKGVGASIPVLTYRPKAGNFVVQVGYARGFAGDVAGANRVYLGIGFTRK